jgi:hypothetical protein
MQGYNAQAVCNEHQIVVAAELNADSPDFVHLDPMVLAAERELAGAGVAKAPAVVVADAGYWHHDQMDALAPSTARSERIPGVSTSSWPRRARAPSDETPRARQLVAVPLVEARAALCNGRISAARDSPGIYTAALPHRGRSNRTAAKGRGLGLDEVQACLLTIGPQLLFSPCEARTSSSVATAGRPTSRRSKLPSQSGTNRRWLAPRATLAWR